MHWMISLHWLLDLATKMDTLPFWVCRLKIWLGVGTIFPSIYCYCFFIVVRWWRCTSNHWASLSCSDQNRTNSCSTLLLLLLLSLFVITDALVWMQYRYPGSYFVDASSAYHSSSHETFFFGFWRLRRCVRRNLWKGLDCCSRMTKYDELGTFFVIIVFFVFGGKGPISFVLRKCCCPSSFIIC